MSKDESALNQTVVAAQDLLEAVAPNGHGKEDEAGAAAEATPDANATPESVGGAPRQRLQRKKKTTGKRSRKGASAANKRTSEAASAPRKRVSRSFPAAPFEEALELPLAIQKIGGGEKVRRLTLFEQLDKSPESGPSRMMITNSSRYGLTSGSYSAEWLELTAQGKVATSSDISDREQLRARFELAIAGIAPFKALYDRFKDHRVPTHAVMRDALAEEGHKDDELQECVETFIVNAKFLGLLRTIAGSERLFSIEQLTDELPARATRTAALTEGLIAPATTSNGTDSVFAGDDWSRICFFVAPIGDENTEMRLHSDLILASLVEPAIEELELGVVRADGIDRPGVITAQVIEHIAKARLVVADLSFHNPNVFYELALRHATGKPTVHLIRAQDRIPFDIDQFRTIRIDTTDLYTFVPQIETYKAEIATQARRALDEENTPAGPLTIFYPDLGVGLNGRND